MRKANSKTEAPESATKKLSRVRKIIGLLKRYYPEAKCALNYSSPEQLLVATVLSAQCTDERVNKVTEVLFKKYPDVASLAKAKLKDLESEVRSTGFYKNKAKNIKAAAEIMINKFGGYAPRTMEELIQLPGVGRKTANVVLGNAFGIASGIVVDTHVTRLSRRLNLSRKKTAEQIEVDLVQLVAEEDWIQFSHWLIIHGRQVCKARKPRCETCFLSEDCPKLN